MHFCLIGQYTPQALKAMMANPTANRSEAVKKMLEAVGGKLIVMYGMPAEGPGVLTIVDVPDPGLRLPFRPWSSPKASCTT